MSNISEIAGQLKTALEDAQKAHATLEEAQAKLAPLSEAAKAADNRVNILMGQYQGLTQPSDNTVVRRRGGAGAKRAPRSFMAVAMTASTRLLNELHNSGTAKKNATVQAWERVTLLAKTKNEKTTGEMEKAVAAKAEEIWSKK